MAAPFLWSHEERGITFSTQALPPDPRENETSSTTVPSQDLLCSDSSPLLTAPFGWHVSPRFMLLVGAVPPILLCFSLPPKQAQSSWEAGPLPAHCSAIAPLAKSHLMHQVSKWLERYIGFLRGTSLAKAETGSNLIICSSHTVRDTLTYSKTPWVVQRMNKHDSLPLWHPGHEE